MILSDVRDAARWSAAIYDPSDFVALAESQQDQSTIINVRNHRVGVSWCATLVRITFCGTNDKKDVLLDIDAEQENDLPHWAPPNATMHSGVLKALLALRAPLLSCLQRNHMYGKPIIFQGHSLGGMLAAAFCADPLFSASAKLCYTFGAARVGNKAFCDSIKVPTVRVVNSLDIVPMLPLKLMSIVFGKCRHHEDILVYITGGGVITTEPPSVWRIGEDIVRAIIKDACDADYIPATLQYHFIDSYLKALGV